MSMGWGALYYMGMGILLGSLFFPAGGLAKSHRVANVVGLIFVLLGIIGDVRS